MPFHLATTLATVLFLFSLTITAQCPAHYYEVKIEGQKPQPVCGCKATEKKPDVCEKILDPGQSSFPFRFDS